MKMDYPRILGALDTGFYDSGIGDKRMLHIYLGAKTASVVTQNESAVQWSPDSSSLQVTRTKISDFLFANEPLRYLQEDVGNLPGLGLLYHLPTFTKHLGILRQKLWIGGKGLVTPLHYDPVETLHWCVKGKKRFTIYRPADTRLLYPHPWHSSTPFISQVDIEHYDREHYDRERFPDFVWLQAQTFELNEGEVLVLPAFWWHHVRSLGDFNVSLNMVWHTTWSKRLECWRQAIPSWRHMRRQIKKSRSGQR